MKSGYAVYLQEKERAILKDLLQKQILDLKMVRNYGNWQNVVDYELPICQNILKKIEKVDEVKMP